MKASITGDSCGYPREVPRALGLIPVVQPQPYELKHGCQLRGHFKCLFQIHLCVPTTSDEVTFDRR